MTSMKKNSVGDRPVGHGSMKAGVGGAKWGAGLLKLNTVAAYDN